MRRITWHRRKSTDLHQWRVAVFAVWCVLAAAMLLTHRAQAQPVSSAEILLFETDHLHAVKVPAILVYEFRKASNVETGFVDKVQLDLADRQGGRHAALHFLSGERQREVPALDDVHGNPVLLGFLERDIAEMQRLTGGSASYFRKRIRMALAGTAPVAAQQALVFGGKTLQGRMVRIQPYLNDPLGARFAPYVRKTYTFIVSDQVPGSVYQLSTSLANPGPTTSALGAGESKPAPAIDETLTLVKLAQP